MKPFRTNITQFALAGSLSLVVSACNQSGDESGTESVTEHVATLDAVAMLGPTPEELPLTESPVIFEGAMQLCTTGESYEVRVARATQGDGGTCEAFPMEWFIKEGSFPYVDLMVDGTAYRANEVHLVHRAGEWLLFTEGSRDEYLIQEHIGNVLQVVEDDDIQLVSRCSGRLYAWHEEATPEFWQCFQNTIHSLDMALIKWTEDDSCVVDYSFCPGAPA